MLQNQNLSPQVLNVLIRHEFFARYGLARVFSACGFLGAETRDAELAAAQLLLEGINGIYVGVRLAQNWSDLGGRGALAERASGVGAGFGWSWLVKRVGFFVGLCLLEVVRW